MSGNCSDGTEHVTAEEIRKWEEEHDEPHPVFEVEHRPERKSVRSKRDDLVYSGVCPVCGDEFTDGFEWLEDLQGESIEGVRICVIDLPEENLFHLPEDQSDRSQDASTNSPLSSASKLGNFSQHIRNRAPKGCVQLE